MLTKKASSIVKTIYIILLQKLEHLIVKKQNDAKNLWNEIKYDFNTLLTRKFIYHLVQASKASPPKNGFLQ